MEQLGRKPRVLISVPAKPPFINKLLVHRLLLMSHDPRIDWKIILPTWVPWEHAQNRVVVDFLEGECDFWVSIDADQSPEGNPIDLVFLNCDVVGMPTPVWHNEKPEDWPIYYNAYHKVEGGYRPVQGRECHGLVEVDCIGGGSFVVARRVLERIAPPWFERRYDNQGLVALGPDFSFCEKVRKVGFSIFAHYGYPSKHFNLLELNEVQRELIKVKEGVGVVSCEASG